MRFLMVVCMMSVVGDGDLREVDVRLGMTPTVYIPIPIEMQENIEGGNIPLFRNTMRGGLKI